MVLDTSAIMAILLQEPEADRLSASIEQDPVRLISAANWLELQIVFRSRTGAEGSELAEAFLRESRMEVVALDRVHVDTAFAAWLRFGKGRHPAGLNFGGCCAYACAILSGHDLLFKGDDFSKTDVPTVRY